MSPQNPQKNAPSPLWLEHTLLHPVHCQTILLFTQVILPVEARCKTVKNKSQSMFLPVLLALLGGKFPAGPISTTPSSDDRYLETRSGPRPLYTWFKWHVKHSYFAPTELCPNNTNISYTCNNTLKTATFAGTT